MPGIELLDPTQNGRSANHLENKLGQLIVGQEEAIHQIVRAYQTHVAGLSPVGRPIGNVLFLGPTGSGKTRIVEATAESLLKNSRAVIKIDCAEFQHSHEIAKLIGSPPGYLGHRIRRVVESSFRHPGQRRLDAGRQPQSRFFVGDDFHDQQSRRG